MFIEMIVDRVKFIVDVKVYLGEDEMIVLV